MQVSLQMSHLIVSGTTEKLKQRSSTEDNKMKVVTFGGCGPRDLGMSYVGSIHEQQVTTITNIAFSVSLTCHGV
jgi:hypothetical protein